MFYQSILIFKRSCPSNGNQTNSHYKGNVCNFFDTCFESKLYASCCVELCKLCTSNDCRWLCPNYESARCLETNTPPYVCNGCVNSPDCGYPKQYYSSTKAHHKYEHNLSESRKRINMEPEELQRLNDLISPLVRNGQPLSHISATHSHKILCSRRTVYNYLNLGLFNVRNINLPRRVRFKIRR